jgi:hypothetical protein
MFYMHKIISAGNCLWIFYVDPEKSSVHLNLYLAVIFIVKQQGGTKLLTSS